MVSVEVRCVCVVFSPWVKTETEARMDLMISKFPPDEAVYQPSLVEKGIAGIEFRLKSV